MIKVLRYRKELEAMFDKDCNYGYDLVLANKVAKFGISVEEASRFKGFFIGQVVEVVIDEELGGKENCKLYSSNFNSRTLFLTRKKAENRYIWNRWNEDRAKHESLESFLKELAEETNE